MPTEFLAQNGTKINEDTTIGVTGCPPTRAKAKALTRAQKLSKALKACKRKGNKIKREACERSAHKDFGTKGRSKKK